MLLRRQTCPMANYLLPAALLCLVASSALALPDSLHCRLVGTLEFAEQMSATACVASDGYCYVGGELSSGQICVLDVSDTADIHVAGRTRTAAGDVISAIVKSGNYLCASSWDGELVVVNVQDPTHPVQAGHQNFGDTMGLDIAVSGAHAYLAEDFGLRVVNIADPAHPATVARLPLGWCSSIAASSQYAFLIADETLLTVVDIQNPANPILRGTLSLTGVGWGFDLALKNSCVFIATDAGLEVVDVSDPGNPTEAAFLELEQTTNIEVSGNNAWLGGFGVLYLVDISDPADPRTVARSNEFNTGPGDALSVAGSFVYNADPEEFRVLAYTTGGPVLTGHVGQWRSFGVWYQDSLAYVAAGSDGLKIVNCANPRSPSVLGTFLCSHAMDVCVKDTFAYVADDTLLRVVKVKDPHNPSQVSSLRIRNEVYGVCVAGNYAYLAALDSGLRVVSISNPANPVLTGFTYAPRDAEDVFVRDTLAFVADMVTGLRIISIANPSQPRQIGSYDDSLGLTYCVHVQGNYAYCADDAAGLRVIDITDPAAPHKAGELELGIELTGVLVRDSLAYVTDWNDFFVVDVSDPASPAQVGNLSLEGEDLALSGNYAYVVGNGLSVVNVSNPAGGLHVAGRFEYPTGNETRDVEAQGSYAYITSDSGLQVIDVSTPSQPRSVAVCPGEGFSRLALGPGLAYVTQTESLIIVDITNPLNPIRAGRYFSADGEPHGVASSGSYVYLTCGRPDSSSGLRIIDVSNPANPQPRGFSNLGRAISIRSVAVHDSWAFVTADSTDREGVFFFKVANPDAPSALCFRWLGGNPVGLAIPDTLCYIAAGDTCGLLIYNVANPVNPTRVSKLLEPGSYTEDIGYRNGYAYVADNQLGLRVMDVDPAQNPALYGYYEPAGDWYHDLCVTPRYVYVTGAARLSTIETDLSGIEETPNSEVRTPNFGPTIVRGVLLLPSPLLTAHYSLLTPAGRKVMDLMPGPNDIRHLAPGIYFVRSEPSAVSGEPSAVHRLVVLR